MHAIRFIPVHLRLVVYLGFLLILVSCDAASPGFTCLSPEGERISSTRPLDSFATVRIQGDFEVFLTQGDTYQLEIKAAANLIGNLSSDIQQGQLTIQNKRCVHHTGRLYLFLQAPHLEAVRLEGSTYLNTEQWEEDALSLHIQDNSAADMALAVEELDTFLGNEANLCIRGSAQSHYASLNGDGMLHAGAFVTTSTRLGLNGTGTATVLATDYLEATLAGGGTAFYNGNPEVKARVAGDSRLLEVP